MASQIAWHLLHQSDLMALLTHPSGPMVQPAARLHAHQAERAIRKELQKVRSFERRR